MQFSVNRYTHRAGVIFYDSAYYVVTVRIEGEMALFLYVNRSRVESACFSITLTPDQLREAIALLRKAENGVEAWLAPGLELTQRIISNGSGNPALLEVIPRLLKSLRHIPRPQSGKDTTDKALKSTSGRTPKKRPR